MPSSKTILMTRGKIILCRNLEKKVGSGSCKKKVPFERFRCKTGLVAKKGGGGERAVYYYIVAMASLCQIAFKEAVYKCAKDRTALIILSGTDTELPSGKSTKLKKISRGFSCFLR